MELSTVCGCRINIIFILISTNDILFFLNVSHYTNIEKDENSNEKIPNEDLSLPITGITTINSLLLVCCYFVHYFLLSLILETFFMLMPFLRE